MLSRCLTSAPSDPADSSDSSDPSRNKRFLNEIERGVADCPGIYVTSIFVELYGKDWAMFRECMFMRLSFAF